MCINHWFLFFFFCNFTGSASIWVQQHTIYYRPVEEEPTATSNASNKGSSTSSTSYSRKSSKNSNSKMLRRKPEFWVDGTAPPIVSALTPFLVSKLPADCVTVQDASLDALAMLRILNALNRHWSILYFSVPQVNIIQQSEFIHSKVSFAADMYM
jgi:E3 ubiquitin-protein ligase TRIP12